MSATTASDDSVRNDVSSGAGSDGKSDAGAEEAVQRSPDGGVDEQTNMTERADAHGALQNKLN